MGRIMGRRGMGEYGKGIREERECGSIGRKGLWANTSVGEYGKEGKTWRTKK